jgi:hypothetical protein
MRRHIRRILFVSARIDIPARTVTLQVVVSALAPEVVEFGLQAV